MRKDLAVQLKNISKVYKLYDKPIDRFKESLHPLKKKYHKDFYALKNINLEIKKGEVLGIVGVNGAGKSTLLKIISGVLTPTMGRVNISGKINAILELGSSLKPEMTGRENIKLNLQINNIEKDREDITKEIIEFADIGEHIDQPIKSYSSGMKARLGFAIATSTDPDVLIVDEVLAVGDVLFKRKCFSRIESLFKDGKTVIFVSHSAQSVIEFCSRAVLLYDREIIMDDIPKKVTDYYQKLVFSQDKQKVLDLINRKIEVQQESQSTKSKSINETLQYSKENFVSNLQIKPEIINNFDINLNTPYILNDKQEIVNQLETGQTYQLILNGNLTKYDENLTFGITFYTVKGFEFSCTREYIKEQIENHNFTLKWQFKCNFLKGRYFIKIDFRKDYDILYYQATDFMTFEVKDSNNDNKRMKMCLVDLEQKLIGNN